MRLALLAIPVLATAGLLAGVVTRSPEPVPVVETPPPTVAPTPVPAILVDVVGAVAHPGVVRLPAGSRVLDALLAAGGMTGDADLFALNKAATLRDGARIYVPHPGEIVPAGSLGSDAERKLDLNAATAAELDGLPGIGQATALRIVRSRDERRFTRVEELQTRGLVPPKVLADVRDFVTVR